MTSQLKDSIEAPTGGRRTKYSIVTTYEGLANSITGTKSPKSPKSPTKPKGENPKLRRNGSLRSLRYPGVTVNVSRTLRRRHSLGSFQKEVELRRRDQHVTENMVLEEAEAGYISLFLIRMYYKRVDVDIDKYYVRKKHVLGTGISVVRTCIHKGTGRRFALKTLDKTGLSDTELGRLGEEIRVMAQVDHPYIVRLYESFETPTEIHLVMELLTGGDLLEKLTTQLGDSHNEMIVCKELQTILNAVRYIHDHHIVHRDLKLENFLFENEKPDAALKLIDFGFAQRFQADEILSGALGTAYYVAPEVLMKSYTYKCDIWSIGVIAYMLLTGSPPFDGHSDVEILDAVRAGRYTFDPLLFHGVSDLAKDFVRRCLTYDPDKRPTAEEAQRHPWFLTLNINTPRVLSSNILSRLKAFRQKTALSRLCLEAVAFALSPEQLTKLREEFVKFDLDNTGCVTFEDLRIVLATNGSFTSQEVSEIFTGIDLEGTGEIRYHELMAAMLSRHYQKHENLKLAFDRMAHHKDHITYADIRDLLGKDYSDDDAEKMLTDLNLSTDAIIKFNDFINIMRDSHRKQMRHHGHIPRFDRSHSLGSSKKDGATSPRRVGSVTSVTSGDGSVSPRNQRGSHPHLSDLFGPPDAPIPVNFNGISHLHFKSASMIPTPAAHPSFASIVNSIKKQTTPVTPTNSNTVHVHHSSSKHFETSSGSSTTVQVEHSSSKNLEPINAVHVQHSASKLFEVYTNSVHIQHSSSKKFEPQYSFGISVVGPPTTPKASHVLAKPSTPSRGNRSIISLDNAI